MSQNEAKTSSSRSKSKTKRKLVIAEKPMEEVNEEIDPQITEEMSIITGLEEENREHSLDIDLQLAPSPSPSNHSPSTNEEGDVPQIEDKNGPTESNDAEIERDSPTETESNSPTESNHPIESENPAESTSRIESDLQTESEPKDNSLDESSDNNLNASHSVEHEDNIDVESIDDQTEDDDIDDSETLASIKDKKRIKKKIKGKNMKLNSKILSEPTEKKRRLMMVDSDDESQDYSNNTPMMIKVIDQHGNSLVFRMLPDTQFRKVMNIFATKMTHHLDDLRFLADGCLVRARDTPRQMEIRDGDVIEVFMRQSGGSN